MRWPWLVLFVLVFAGRCATAPEPPESPTARRKVPVDAGQPTEALTAADAAPAIEAHPPPSIPPAVETWGGMGFQEVNEKVWLADVRNKLAERLKVEPAQLLFSPGKLRVAFVRGPAEQNLAKRTGPARPRRFQIVVVDNQGRPQGTFRPVTMKGSDAPPKDLRFLNDDRLVYEVAPPPPAEASPVKVPAAAGPPIKPVKRSTPAKARAVRRGSGKRIHHQSVVATPPPPPPSQAPPAGKPAPPPTRLFIIQPVEPRARVIRCEGHDFTFPATGNHLAFIGGTPEAAYVAVDGAPTYPRHGRTVIASPAAWSKDGHSLAFLETPADGPARLVLLAEFDNPTGDTTWNLPPAAAVEGTRVFWASTGRLVVGKSLTHPVFSASFQKLR
jgi:hypothetical protein